MPESNEYEPLTSSLPADDFGPLIAKFVEGLSGRLASLREALETGNLSEARKIAHQLRGAAASYGYPSIAEQVQRIEDQLEKGSSYDAWKAMVEELSTLCLRAKKGLAS